MRWLCSLSLVLLATGCGAHRASPSDPFAYNARRPLAVRSEGVIMSGPRLAVHALSYAAGTGERVEAFIAAPRRGGPYPAVLFLHGSGGDRESFLVPAIQLALRGAVTMTITEPDDAQTYRPLIVNARRALDVLSTLPSVDRSRMGVVGYSLGGQLAAILAGDEPRLKAVGIIAGRGNSVTVYWVRRTHAHLFFEAGLFDQVVPHAQLEALIHAAPDHPRVRWFATDHGMNQRAMDEQLAWQESQLRIGRGGSAAGR